MPPATPTAHAHATPTPRPRHALHGGTKCPPFQFEDAIGGRTDRISPMASADRGRALDTAATPRRLAQPQSQGGRGGQTHRPAGWKRRRPRPRLSHKGPMPF
ncbi:hypothetical protein CRUP_025876 [Coryphaenoides rupestris]|nr:hypothetical protein CRUP_025876 [Coryphaenoides rupestris]